MAYLTKKGVAAKYECTYVTRNALPARYLNKKLYKMAKNDEGHMKVTTIGGSHKKRKK